MSFSFQRALLCIDKVHQELQAEISLALSVSGICQNPFSKIKFCNIFCLTDVVSAIIHSGHWKRVCFSHRIHFSVVSAHTNVPSGFGTRIQGELQSLWLGSIKSLSNKY